MATTLTHGLQIPDTGERGSTFFPILEAWATRIDDHTHNGTDAEKIAVKDLTKSTASIASGSWVAVSGQAGTFEQTVTLPAGYSMDTTEIKLLDPSGHPLLLSIEKISATQFRVFINDNTLTLTAVYG